MKAITTGPLRAQYACDRSGPDGNRSRTPPSNRDLDRACLPRPVTPTHPRQTHRNRVCDPPLPTRSHGPSSQIPRVNSTRGCPVPQPRSARRAKPVQHGRLNDQARSYLDRRESRCTQVRTPARLVEDPYRDSRAGQHFRTRSRGPRGVRGESMAPLARRSRTSAENVSAKRISRRSTPA